jgi:hypothetical protein
MEYVEITNSQFMKGLETGRNMLVFGKSGWGKTATVEEYAKKHGLKIAYVDMAGQLPESIAGIPAIYTKESDGLGGQYYKRMLDIELKEFLECEGEGWILFFDEINQGNQESLNTLYSITHPDPSMRRWCGHRISKCQIVACGNLSDGTDGTVYLTDLPTPLLNRFFVFKLKLSKKDASAYLRKKYKNIPQVAKYINVMLDNDIAPRDVDLALDILQFDHDGMFLEAKLGASLTAKIYDIQKDIKDKNPAELLNNAKKVYEQFKETGYVTFGLDKVETEEDLREHLLEILSEEEVKAVMKGDE